METFAAAVPKGLKKPQPAEGGGDACVCTCEPGAAAGTPLFLRGFADVPQTGFEEKPAEKPEEKTGQKPGEEKKGKEDEKKEGDKKEEDKKDEDKKKKEDEEKDKEKDKKKEDEKKPQGPKDAAGDKAAGAPGSDATGAEGADAAGPADAAADAAAGAAEAGGKGGAAGGPDAAGGPGADAAGGKGGGGKGGGAAGGGAGGGAKGADNPSDFRDQIREASQRIPQPAGGGGGGGGGPAKAAAAAAVNKLELVPKKVAVQADAAEPSPKPVPPVPAPTAENPVPHADSLVAGASGKVLEPQTPPPFETTPRGNMPQLGRNPLGAEGLRRLQKINEEGAVPDILPEKQKEQKSLIELREKMLHPTPEQQKAGEPVPIRQMAPGEPLPQSPEVKAQQAQVFARLMSDPGQTAQDALKEARENLYPDGIVQATKPDLGSGLAADLAASFTQQLNTLREMAGVGLEDVNGEIAKRQATARDQSLAAKSAVEQQTQEAGKDVTKAAQGANDASASAAATLQKKGETVASAAQGAGDTSSLSGQRDSLISRLNASTAKAAAGYTQAGADRQKELDSVKGNYRNAYVAAYEQDVLQIRELSPLGTADTALREDEIKSEQWRDRVVAQVETNFAGLKESARVKVETLQVDLNTAATQGREEIRAWAEQQTGVARTGADRLLEAAADFAAQAAANGKALQEQQDRQTADMVGGNLALIEKLKKAADDKISEGDLLANNELSAEQRAIVQSFFHQEGAPFDPIEAVAKGILSRIVGERKAELDSKLKSELLEKATWQELEKIGNAVGPQADIGKKALDIHEALHGGLFGSNEVEKAMGALAGGMNELQLKALRICYAATYKDEGLDLDKDLEGQLSEGEGKRAKALLSGDKEAAIAAQLYSAMKETAWGTGLGTDEKTIFKALRGLSEEERKKVIAAYKRDFKGNLEEEVKGELDDWTTTDKHDSERAQALFEGNTQKADAIAVDQALYAGGDREDATAVYDQVRSDVEEQAKREGWTSAQREAEITRRNRLMETEYDEKYAKTTVVVTGPDGELMHVPHGSLRDSFKNRLRGSGGAEAKLLEAYADNKRDAIDAAKIGIERKSTYTGDTAVNEVLESQYNKALEDARADHGSEIRRQKQLAMEAEEKKSNVPWTAAERYKRQQQMEAEIEAEIVKKAQDGAQQKMEALKKTYAGEYGETLDKVVEDGMGGNAAKEAKVLLGRGYLKPYEKVKFAVNGLGTRDELGKAGVKGRTKAELAEMRRQWLLDPDTEGTLDEALRGDYSGDDLNEIEIDLMGKPETVEDLVAIQQKKVAQEQPAWYSPNVAGPEKKMMEGRLHDLEALAKEVNDPKKRTPEEQKRLLGQLDFQAETVGSAVEAHHAAVASVTDSVANVASITVALAIGIGGAIFTGGASAAVALAIIASLASTATSIGTKLLLRGGGYGWEEMMTDVGIGVLDAVVSGLTAGMGSRLLGIKQIAKVAAKEGAEEGAKAAVKASIKSKIVAGLAKLGNVGKLANKMPAISFLEKMAAEEAAWYSKLAAKAISESIENAVQSLPSALVGNALDKENWKGNPLKNILSATGGQLAHGVAMGLGMSAGMGALHSIGGMVKGPKLGAETHATAPEHMTPHERAAHLAEFKEMYPGKTEADFDASVAKEHAAATAKAADEAAYREKVREHLIEGSDGAKAHVGEVPITILDPADFYRVRGLGSGDAVVVMRDGQAHLVVKKGAEPKSVREHAPKLKEMVEPGTGGRSKNLKDTLPRDLRNRVPIEVNPKLEGETVRVHYDHDPVSGVVTNVRIEVGPNARAVDIHNHVATARAMRKYAGLSGEVRAVLRGVQEKIGLKPSFRPGTPEFEAHLEVKKLPGIIHERMSALQRLEPGSEEAMLIAVDVEHLKGQLEAHKATLLEGGGETRGYVAADRLSQTQMKERLEALDPKTREKLQALSIESLEHVLSRPHLLEMYAGHDELLGRYLDVVERLRGFPLADTHVHIPGLISPEDLFTWLLRKGLAPKGSGEGVKLGTGVNSIEGRIGKLIESSPLGKAQKKAFLKELSQFTDLLKKVNKDLPVAGTHPKEAVLRERAARLTEKLESLVSLPVKGQAAPLTTEFFTLFAGGHTPLYKGPLGLELTALAIERMRERGISLELRQGVTPELSAFVQKHLELHPEHAHDILGLIYSQVKQYPDDVTFLTRLGEITGHKHLVGSDLSGKEVGGLSKDAEGKLTKGLSAEKVAPSARKIVERNFEVLSHAFEKDTTLRAAGRERLAALKTDPTFKNELGETLRRLGIDPEGRLDPVAIMKKMKEKMGEGSLSYRDVARVNRLVRETVLEVDAMRHHGQSRLGASGSEHALQGVTVHGGEQVRGSVLLKTLISDLQVIVAAGADRIGHGVILGLPFVTEKGKINTALLEHLGFEWNEKTGTWRREHGSSFETLTHTEIYEMERARRGLLRTISDNGVVIEINPSSNIIISGLDPTNHPIKQMLHDAPYLRFSVNTDNPGIHLTDVSSEMAHLYATGALTWPQTVRGALEGFGSRLGSRPLPEALALRQRTEDAIVRGTKPHERRQVIDELSRRHPHLPQELGDVSSDAAFRKALDPYLKKTFQIPDKGRKTLGS